MHGKNYLAVQHARLTKRRGHTVIIDPAA
jgi:hypothetical protein